MTTPVRPLVRAACALVLVVAVVGGCGEQAAEDTSRGSADHTPSSSPEPDAPGDATGTRAAGAATRLGPDDPRPEVECGGEPVSMMVLDYARGARGAPTPEAAVQERARGGETFVMTEDGGTAWILRTDGTAREKVTLTQRQGWLAATVEAC